MKKGEVLLIIIKAAVKSDAQFLFTAPVMIPNKPDCDYKRGEKLFTEEEVRFFKESFQNYQIIDKNHQVFLNGGSAKQIGDPVDSFLLEEDTTYELTDGTTETYPKGTWMLTTDVTDPTAQQEIEDGILTGYSPSVHNKLVGELIKKAMAIKSSQGELIKDIPNPEAITVSIVRKPCQSGSKQCKIKGDKMDADKKTLDKIKALLGVEGKPEYATKEDFDALAKELKETNASLKSMSEDVGKTVAESIVAALSEVGSIKSKKEEEGEDSGNKSGDGESSQKEGEGTKPSKEDGEGKTSTKEEGDDKKNKNKNKGSKQGSVHNGATKSNYDEELDTYAFLGRTPNGLAKRN